eukprot:7500587-Ditylum_brightwellii.AAC.1
MRIAKKNSRGDIQLVATKKQLIVFEIVEGVDQKLGESRTYKLCMQPEEDNSHVYLLTVKVFELVSPKEWLISKKQALENLDNCLNAVTVQVFPNKVHKLHKLHKQYI